MRVVLVGDALHGERLAFDVYDQSGRLLLASGSVLTPRYIRELSARGYRSIGIVDPLAPDVRQTEPLRAQTRDQATRTVMRCMTSVRGQSGGIQSAGILAIIEDILRCIQASGALAVNLLSLRSMETELFTHSVNVCAYTLLLASDSDLGLDRVDLRHLGIGALLHDIGKIFCMDLVSRDGPLSPEEHQRLRHHTVDGFEWLRRQQEVDLRSAHVAFQHHERLDGSGYPRGLSGEQIHPWARLVAVADGYDAATADHPGSDCRPPHLVLAELEAEAAAGRLDRRFTSLLRTRVAAYPVGSILRLASGEIAIVVAQTEAGPDRPRFRVLADAQLTRTAPEERDAGPGGPETEIAQVLPDYPDALLEGTP